MAPEVSIGNALYDYLPVLVWIWGSYCLINAVRNEIKKIFHSLLVFSVVLVCIAGTLKATWKLLLAAGSNIQILSDVQFPLMGTGFLIMFISLLPLLLQKKVNESGKLIAIASLKKVFLPLMVLGGTGSTVCLMIIAKRKKAVAALIFYSIFLVISNSLGYIGSKFHPVTNFDVFLEQTVNCFSTLAWAFGSYFLCKTNKKANKFIFDKSRS